MSRVIQISDSKTSSLTSYDSGYHIHADSANLNNACDGDDTTYASIRFVNGSNAETYIFYNFSTLNIPQEATNINVACTVKGYLNNTGGTSTRTLQLYSGSTPMGTAKSITTQQSVQTLSLTPGTWTAAQLSEAKLRFYAKRNTSATTTTRLYRIYEAVMTVAYTIEQLQYEVTATSNSQNITVSSTQEWINAGEDYELDIYGDITNAEITDNSSDIKSSLVAIGNDEYRYSLTNLQADHSVVIVLAGDKIFKKINGAWVESANVYIKVNGTWEPPAKAYKKENGAWVEQSDISAMFDPNAFFVSI